MENILNNTWFVGIVGGIISGIIVYIVTDKFFAKKQNREYLQKVSSANNEIIYILRPLIAQKQIPSIVIIESLIESVGRKYGTLRKDLLSTGAIIDDLIREIMENAFLDVQLKIEYSDKVMDIKKENAIENKISDTYEKYSVKARGIATELTSILLATVAGLTALFLSLISTKEGVLLNGLNQFQDIGTNALAGITLPIIALAISFLIISVKTTGSKSRFGRLINKLVNK